MTALPRGWALSTLAEIGDYLNGRGFKKSEWRENGRPIIRIQNLTGSADHFNYFDGEAEEHYTAREGDLLVSWAATLGVFVWKGPEAVINQHIFKVRSYIDRDFHRYLLLSVLDELRRHTHGSGMVHITKGRFEATPVAVPPLVEQQRIVAAIEEHFSRLDAAEKSLRAAAARLRVMRDAVYVRAVSGAWRKVPLEALLREPLRNGHSAKASQDGTGVRTLTLSAVTQDDFSEKNTKLTTADPSRIGGLWLEPGDILIERSNTPELVGTAALYEGPRNWAIFPDLLIRVRLSDGCSAEFPRDRAEGEAISPLLPALCSGHRGEHAEDRSGARRTTRGPIERAFSGRLVPQDPSDEPASALLERIQAQRAAAETATGRRPRRRATMKAS